MRFVEPSGVSLAAEELMDRKTDRLRDLR